MGIDIAVGVDIGVDIDIGVGVIVAALKKGRRVEGGSFWGVVG